MQNLHKLRMMEKPISINFTRCLPSLLLATASILIEQRNSGSGQQRCWILLPSRAMYWIKADHTKEHMGLTSWHNAPDGKIVKADVSVAKNYLSKPEMQELNEIVTMYLDYATRQARRHIPMTMADWATKLDAFLQFNDAEILQIQQMKLNK